MKTENEGHQQTMLTALQLHSGQPPVHGQVQASTLWRLGAQRLGSQQEAPFPTPHTGLDRNAPDCMADYLGLLPWAHREASSSEPTFSIQS